MRYIHIKNLEKFHPGYKDRTLHWAKIYFTMVQGDTDCELITNEVDWSRLIKFILLELEAKQPIPLKENYLIKKGFNLKKRPILLTLTVLHNFIDIVTERTNVPSQEGGCIYFLQEAKSKLIKIGYSEYLKERMQQLERTTNQEIKFLYGHKGTIQIENAYHNKFSNLRVSPEWYKDNGEIFKFIEKLKEDVDIINVTESFTNRSLLLRRVRVREDKDKE